MHQKSFIETLRNEVSIAVKKRVFEIWGKFGVLFEP
jgi:hypothetical protein